MKYLLMYFAMFYIVFCADNVKDYGDTHSLPHRIIRGLVWPLTITSWFNSQSIRLHRMLNILWCVLIMGWFLSLMADRI